MINLAPLTTALSILLAILLFAVDRDSRRRIKAAEEKSGKSMEM
jgi:hypothetical protein